MATVDVKSLYLTELEAEVRELSLPSFRARQIYEWLHVRGAMSFDDMTNLSKELRASISECFEIYGCEIEKKFTSELDGTVKYLFKLHDGELIEAVLMHYKYGSTLCISTQVGCRMGCAFCASGLCGFVRNLTASEMLSQIHAAQNDMKIRVSHIVLMGMGEPLDNYANVLRFLKLVSNPDGLNIGMRNISLSTSGLVDKIYDLLSEKLQLTLSVSLHAPNDQIRSNIMPVNKKYPVNELLTACKKYTQLTSRRISFEYAMISGVNDSDECAQELSTKLKGMLCHVNLIPANEVSENSFTKSTSERLGRFSNILGKNGINVTVRRSLGSDINASCGQLRNRHQKGEV